MHDGRPVLLALDDDPSIGDVVRAIAEEAGFFATVTTSEKAFKEFLYRYVPSVLVLDLQMPKFDGVQVLRYLGDRGIRAGVLVVSGMHQRTIASAEQYAMARGLQVLGTLQKPFQPEELLERLMFAKAATQPLTAADLELAIDNDELEVYYQPTIQSFADGTWDVASMEALVRWNHPERGVLLPDTFIAMSEREGLGRELTDYVIRRGVEQLKGWYAERLNIGLRVNVPAILVADIDFPDRLESLLVEQDVDPSDLTLEITETAMLDQGTDTFDILTRMRVKNINLAIDDFGVGYSSLTQLCQMPFNEMKIDRALVMRTAKSREARIMVEALVDLAHKLNLTVCAEGVEDNETLDFLGSISCDSVQGFLVSPPVPGKMVAEIVRRWDALQRTSNQFRAHLSSGQCAVP